MKRINLAITGCMGRMGQQLIKSARSDKSFKLVSPISNLQKLSVNKSIKFVKMGKIKEAEKAIRPAVNHLIKMNCKKFILDKQCLKRQLKPSDVANLVLYLSSDVSSGCTKQNFIVDAGIT